MSLVRLDYWVNVVSLVIIYNNKRPLTPKSMPPAGELSNKRIIDYWGNVVRLVRSLRLTTRSAEACYDW